MRIKGYTDDIGHYHEYKSPWPEVREVLFYPGCSTLNDIEDDLTLGISHKRPDGSEIWVHPIYLDTGSVWPLNVVLTPYDADRGRTSVDPSAPCGISPIVGGGS